MFFTDEEIQRYSRQIGLQGFGVEGQKRLKSSRALIVGVGGLGCPVAQYLAAMGVGTLGLMDHDIVEMSNLSRQILYKESDIGRKKVDCAKEVLQSQNSHIAIHTYLFSFSASNVDVLELYDIVIDGTDQLELRYLLNAACRKQQKAYLFGGITSWQGMAALFYPDSGPCYQCLFPTKPPIEKFPRCVDGGVLGVLPGLIGSLQASEAVRYLALDECKSEGIVHTVSLQSMEFRSFELERDPHCPVCHGDYSQVEYFVPQITIEELSNLLKQNVPVQIVDVREKEELWVGQVQGSIHIPLMQLEEKLHLLSPHKTTVCYCKKGIRSKVAAELLIDHGFDQVYSLYRSHLNVRIFAKSAPLYSV
jgi:sulfur-carrier protein adenylyltransferase/sulfurtransferase